MSFVDLSNTNLRFANLNEANLKGVILNNADLSGADLRSANLNYAVLYNVSLYKANLSNIKLWNTNTMGVRGQTFYNDYGVYGSSEYEEKMKYYNQYQCAINFFKVMKVDSLKDFKAKIETNNREGD